MSSNATIVDTSKEVAVIDEGSTIVVTPSSPLVINETPVTFPVVEIAGGVIFSTVDTQVTFQSLSKTS